jgi:hypothetical protein
MKIKHTGLIFPAVAIAVGLSETIEVSKGDRVKPHMHQEVVLMERGIGNAAVVSVATTSAATVRIMRM